jgi:hypothetical protein
MKLRGKNRLGRRGWQELRPKHCIVHNQLPVSDPHALSAALRAEGCDVLEKNEESQFGKFGWVMDPEGNKVELLLGDTRVLDACPLEGLRLFPE